MTSLSRIGLALVAALTGFAFVAVPNAAAADPTIAGILGAAGPANSVGGFALLGLGGDAAGGINCSASTINGNVGLAGPATFKNAAPCVETGDVYLGSGVSMSGPGDVQGSVITNQSLISQAVSDALSASSIFQGMAATNTSVTSINGGSVTLTASQSGINVVNITGLTNSPDLTFSCGSFPGCQWVVNDSGAFNFTNGSVTLTSGLTANDVLFNVYATEAPINFMAPAYGTGIFLAPYSSWTQEGIWDGELIGGLNGKITLMSATTLTAVPVPVSGAIGLLVATFLAAIGLSVVQVRRRRRGRLPATA